MPTTQHSYSAPRTALLPQETPEITEHLHLHCTQGSRASRRSPRGAALLGEEEAGWGLPGPRGIQLESSINPAKGLPCLAATPPSPNPPSQSTFAQKSSKPSKKSSAQNRASQAKNHAQDHQASHAKQKTQKKTSNPTSACKRRAVFKTLSLLSLCHRCQKHHSQATPCSRKPVTFVTFPPLPKTSQPSNTLLQKTCHFCHFFLVGCLGSYPLAKAAKTKSDKSDAFFQANSTRNSNV